MFTRKSGPAQADLLMQAAAAGDPQAQWGYALLALGMEHVPDALGGNALPFLEEVGSVTASNLNQRAYELIGEAAQGGQTRAMVVQAIWLLHSDRPEAVQLLTDAADRGDTAAMLCLGTELAADDPASAQAWLTRLTGQGDAAGMYALSGLLRQGDPQAAQDWLVKAAAAGNVAAQSDLAVAGFGPGQPLDRDRPPAIDPRLTGVLAASVPLTRQARQVANCLKCGKKTVQDVVEFIIGRWYGLRGPTTAGKTGTRFHFSACTICGCLYPVDAASRQYIHSKGSDFLSP